MPTLFDYTQQVQRFLRDGNQKLIDFQDIISYVNRARREVAMRAECIRILTPISGSVQTVSVTAGGSGYTNPTVTISVPDFPPGSPPLPNGAQATATARVVGGAISAIDVTYGGAGYFQPTVTITDPTGTGATATANVSAYNALQENQEVYYFSGVDLSQFPGVKNIYNIRSISIVYSNYRYSLPMYSFSTYQALIRNYPYQYTWVPTFSTQFGRGTGGSLFCYPIASQVYQMEWDASCLPLDLTSDKDFEAIPEPWTDAVPFLAAYFAYLELQNMNAAEYYNRQFDNWVSRYSVYSQRGRRVNPYGRFLIPLAILGGSLALSVLHSAAGLLT
ncbi:MAG: hypothetical protein KGL39_07600 [Patescibacteria group bacterium]|nr:hypothetical protein [Patescibacteria group bacterium]